MTITLYVDGTAGNDANDGLSSGAPKKTWNACFAANGSVSDALVLYVAAGSAPVIGNTNATGSPGQDFRTPADANFTIRAYGGGARPQITMLGRGIKTQGNGSLDVQDVNLVQDATAQPNTFGNGFTSRTGGGTRLVNCDITGFFNAMQIGTGTVLLDGVRVYAPGNNGFFIDIAPTATLGTGGIIRNCQGYARSPTANDMLSLHNGGIGVAHDWLVEDNLVSATAGAGMESGLDFGEQYMGVTVRRNTAVGATQWGVVQGSLVRGTLNRSFTTRSLMLEGFTRENIGVNAGGPNYRGSITGGTVAFVTADGANNGIYQLTGNDPADLAAWTGPMTADDLMGYASLIYQNHFSGCVGGLQLQHPGTQFVANTMLDVTLGDWRINTSGLIGGGYMIGLTSPVSYGMTVLDNVFSTSSSKYRSVQTGQLAASTRDMVNIVALRSEIAQRVRLTLKGNVIRQRANHTGNFVQFASAADHGYLTSDYNAWIADSGVSDGTWPGFSDSAGTQRTYTDYKAINGGSDAHSLWQTPETALIDDECRLLDGSTLIGAGVARSGVSGTIPAADSENRVLSSPPDIGGYAYVSQSVAAQFKPSLFDLLRAPRTVAGSGGSATAPDTVTGLAVGTITATSLAFTWDAAARAAWYELQYRVSPSGDWTPAPDEFTSTSGSLDGLSAATAYDVQVRAANGAGQSAWSASVTAATT